MTFSFIESLVPTSEDFIEVQGLTFTAPAVLEDDLGIRYLVLPATDGITYTLHGFIWGLASSHGVQVIAAPGNGGWHMDTKEHFVSSRIDKVRDAGFVGTFEIHHADLLTYTEMHTPTSQEPRQGTFVHVHTHSDNSALDGLSYVHEIVAAAVADGNTAVAITDHGNCASHPALQTACDKAGIKPIFGMEAYLVPNRHRRGKPEIKHEDGTITPADSVAALSEYTHVTLWAATNAGLRNLWSMSTEGYREGFYGKPRIDWETLTKFNEGVYASTGCLRGPLAVPLLAQDQDLVTQNLGRMLDIFGDRLVVEIHTNHLDIQMGVNRQLVDIARQHKIRMVAAVDSHYAHRDEAMAHRAWLAVQTDKDITQESGMFGGGQDYHMHTEVEVREALAYLGQDVVDECVANTAWLADQVDARIEGATTTPTFSVASAEHPDPVQRDCERLIDLCLSNWDRVQGKVHDEQVYMDRFEREMSLLTEKHFNGYFLLVAEYVNWAESVGILVGPGRGSGGGSLVAYLSGIVKIDPVEMDLIFERFLTRGRTSLPDFDLDFPMSKREPLKEHVRERWGEDRVVTIGTVTTLRSKGAINSALKVLRPVLGDTIHWPDFQKLTALVDAANAPLAGAYMPWEQFKTEFEDDVAPMIAKYPEVFALIDKFIGRVKSFGKHPAGVVISTEGSLWDLPLRLGENGEMITQFDGPSLEALGYVKCDLLTLRTLDTIQETMDLIKERRGVTINPGAWREEYLDPQVWEAISEGQTMGLFQVETRAGTRLTRQYKPTSVRDLADVMTLVRPGPVKSGLTHTFLERRGGREVVSVPFVELEPILGVTEGCLLYQEQIMQTFMVLAGYDENEADGVRKILGKKLIDKVDAAGQEFVARATALGHDPQLLAVLWAQMAEFAKYSFGAAHAVGYAMLGMWCVSGPTRLYDWDNQEYITIAKAYHKGVKNIACYDEVTGKTVSGKVAQVVRAGRKMGYVLRTKSNKRLECSEKHLILTDTGWRRLEDIRPGDLVASERRVTTMSAERRQSIAKGMERHWKSVTDEDRTRRVQALNDGQDFVFRSERAKARWAEMDQVERQQRVATLIDSGGWTVGVRRGVSPECGHKYASRNEREVCRWMHKRGLEHESQVYINGRPADFRCQGVFIEFDGMNREDSYFEEKFGDEPYVVVRDYHELDRDLGFLLQEEMLRAGGVVTFEPVVSITPTKNVMMYDIIMEEDPHNFLADGVVVHNTAWFKFHFPVEFLTCALSTVDADRIPDFITESRRMGYKIYPPDINLSRVGFTPGQEDIRYGLDAVKGIGVPVAQEIVALQPFSDLDDFVTRAVESKETKVNRGALATLVAVGAFDTMVPNRRGLELSLEHVSSGASKRCVFKDDAARGPGGLPCRFDWDTEPNPPMITKGRGLNKTTEPKPPPKKCSVSCRNYTAPPPVTIDHIDPYTSTDISQRESELLGVWLTHSPFDRVDPTDLEMVASFEDVETGGRGEYVVIAVVSEAKRKFDKNGNEYAFVSLQTPDGVIDTICFNSVYESIRPDLVVGALVSCIVNKNDRGVSLSALVPTL